MNIVYDADGWISVHPQRQHIEFTYPMLAILYALPGSCWKTLAFMMQHCYHYDEGAADFVRGPQQLSVRFIADGSLQDPSTVSDALDKLGRWRLAICVEQGALAAPGRDGTPATWTVNWNLRVRPIEAEYEAWDIEGVDEPFVIKVPKASKSVGKIRTLAAKTEGGAWGKSAQRSVREDKKEEDQSSSSAYANKRALPAVAEPTQGKPLVVPNRVVPPPPRPAPHTGVNPPATGGADDDDAPALTADEQAALRVVTNHFRSKTALEPNDRLPTYRERWCNPLVHLLRGAEWDTERAKGIMDTAIEQARGANSSGKAYPVSAPASLTTWINNIVADEANRGRGNEAETLWERVLQAIKARDSSDRRLVAALGKIGGSKAVLSANVKDVPRLKQELYEAFLSQGVKFGATAS